MVLNEFIRPETWGCQVKVLCEFLPSLPCCSSRLIRVTELLGMHHPCYFRHCCRHNSDSLGVGGAIITDRRRCHRSISISDCICQNIDSLVFGVCQQTFRLAGGLTPWLAGGLTLWLAGGLTLWLAGGLTFDRGFPIFLVI